MKKAGLKDKQKRLIFKKLQLILIQQKMSKRFEKHFLDEPDVSIRQSRIKNRCVLTLRSKGICSDFKLSRIKLRELGLNGMINGLKKISW